MATSSVDLDRVNAQLPSPADDLALRESLEDARVLLWYATRLLGWWNIVNAMVFSPTNGGPATGNVNSAQMAIVKQDPCVRLQQNLQPVEKIDMKPEQDLYGRRKTVGSSNATTSQADSFQELAG